MLLSNHSRATLKYLARHIWFKDRRFPTAELTRFESFRVTVAWLVCFSCLRISVDTLEIDSIMR